MTRAAEHVVGVAQGVQGDSITDLRSIFNGECSEVGMYLAMGRVAAREGYPEIAEYWKPDLTKRAKALNLDAIHDIVNEIGRDEARHGKVFKGLLGLYFGK